MNDESHVNRNPYQSPASVGGNLIDQSHKSAIKWTDYAVISLSVVGTIGFFVFLNIVIHGPPKSLESILPTVDPDGPALNRAFYLCVFCFLTSLSASGIMLFRKNPLVRLCGIIPFIPILILILVWILGQLGDEVGF